MASAASELFATPLGGMAKTTERTLTGLAHQIGLTYALGSALAPSENFSGKAPGDLIIGLGPVNFGIGPGDSIPS